MPKTSSSECHFQEIAYEISRSVSSTLQQFASSQLALRNGSSSQTSGTPSVRALKHFGSSNLFSSLGIFIEVQNQQKNFFSLLIGTPEKPDFSAESEKDGDNDHVIPIFTDDGSVHKIADEHELSFKRENFASQDIICQQAHFLTNLIAEFLQKLNTAGSFGRKCSSESFLERAGTEVNTVNSGF